MEFSGLLVISRAPISDALQAESVIAPIQHTELSRTGKHFFKANAALFIEAIEGVSMSS